MAICTSWWRKQGGKESWKGHLILASAPWQHQKYPALPQACWVSTVHKTPSLAVIHSPTVTKHFLKIHFDLNKSWGNFILNTSSYPLTVWRDIISSISLSFFFSTSGFFIFIYVFIYLKVVCMSSLHPLSSLSFSVLEMHKFLKKKKKKDRKWEDVLKIQERMRTTMTKMRKYNW